MASEGSQASLKAIINVVMIDVSRLLDSDDHITFTRTQALFKSVLSYLKAWYDSQNPPNRSLCDVEESQHVLQVILSISDLVRKRIVSSLRTEFHVKCLLEIDYIHADVDSALAVGALFPCIDIECVEPFTYFYSPNIIVFNYLGVILTFLSLNIST